MRDISKRAGVLSTCSLVLSVLTLLSWWFFLSHTWAFKSDPWACVPKDTRILAQPGASLYVAIIILSAASAVAGFAALKPRFTLQSLLALGICFLNLGHLPFPSVMDPEITPVAALRQINTAEVMYLSQPRMGRYGTIPDLVTATLISESLSNPSLLGYTYNVVVVGEGY